MGGVFPQKNLGFFFPFFNKYTPKTPLFPLVPRFFVKKSFFPPKKKGKNPPSKPKKFLMKKKFWNFLGGL